MLSFILVLLRLILSDAHVVLRAVYKPDPPFNMVPANNDTSQVRGMLVDLLSLVVSVSLS
jgi:hypothetical protein